MLPLRGRLLPLDSSYCVNKMKSFRVFFLFGQSRLWGGGVSLDLFKLFKLSIGGGNHTKILAMKLVECRYRIWLKKNYLCQRKKTIWQRIIFFHRCIKEFLNHTYTPYFMNKDKKSDTLAVFDNSNFCDRHTDRRTQRLYDRPGPEGHVGEHP